MPKVIDSFSGEYDFLSNFYNCPIVYDGLKFNNSEAAYHSVKCPSHRAEFINLNASEAKKLGRKVELRPNWEEIKDNVMYAVCYAKFSQNKDLKIKLLQTGDAKLVEGNSWNDTYWGVCKGKGQNKLGKILMQLREEFQNSTIPYDDSIKVGDICLYWYRDEPNNNSMSIVEVIETKNDTTATVRFLQVFQDDSGNNMFKYLENSTHTMAVSICYLDRINYIQEQNKRIKLMSDSINSLTSQLEDKELNEYEIAHKVREETLKEVFTMLNDRLDTMSLVGINDFKKLRNMFNDVKNDMGRSTPPDKEFPIEFKLVVSNSGNRSISVCVDNDEVITGAEDITEAIQRFDERNDEVDVY